MPVWRPLKYKLSIKFIFNGMKVIYTHITYVLYIYIKVVDYKSFRFLLTRADLFYKYILIEYYSKYT